MAVSDVSICNLALQILGAARITALTDDSPNARSCNACYETIRDKEIRAHPWTFATTRATLAPLSTAPAFDFNYAFPLPTGFLRLILPNRNDLDWRLEIQDGQRVILTNDGDSLNVRYIQRVTDPTLFDPLFVPALAAALADHMCEEITQSNEKKADAKQRYKDAISEARRNNSIEMLPEDPPEDTWVTARILGPRVGNWLRGYTG